MTQIAVSLIRLDGGTQPRAEVGHVYCVQRITGGAVKIGWTTDLNARLAQLQTGAEVPLRYLGYCRGSRALEAALHEAFAAFRLGGEWFEPVPELIDCAKGLDAIFQPDAPVVFGTKPAYRIGTQVKATAALTKSELAAIVSAKRKQIEAMQDQLLVLERALVAVAPIWDRNPEYTYGQAERAFLAAELDAA